MKSKIKWIVFIVALLLINPLATPANSSKSLMNIDDSGIALNGYDPVSYHSEKPQKGNPEISFEYEGITYQFSTKDNLDNFKNNPEKYLPAYGGWCAWAMIDGEKVEVDPKTYKIINDKVYLFYNSFFINTLSKWNKRAEKEAEPVLLEKADGKWEKLLSSN